MSNVFNHRELDFEFARWGAARDPNIGQFVIQPFDATGQISRFIVPSFETNVTLLMYRQFGIVSFYVFSGFYSLSELACAQGAANASDFNVPFYIEPKWRARQLSSFTFAGEDVPTERYEDVHFNLWLNNDKTNPFLNKTVEVVVRNFEYGPIPFACTPNPTPAPPPSSSGVSNNNCLISTLFVALFSHWMTLRAFDCFP